MTAAYTAAQVTAAEAPLLAAGPPGALMERAAFALATHVLRELRRRRRRMPGATVLALVGGGNNGGDALYAAAFLARRGVAASAALVTADPHPAGVAAARAAGVRLVPVGPRHDVPWGVLEAVAARAEVWIDGLAGIGVRGGLREPLAGAVDALTRLRDGGSGEPLVVAVDTPSGIGVDDGTLPGPVLPADVTVTMGVAKPGLLLPPAALVAGRLEVVDLGIAAALDGEQPLVTRLGRADVAALWPVPRPETHKYGRGVLGVVAGSARYPGAGVLAVAGATATGLGMVRYLGDPVVLGAVNAAHPDVVGAAGRVQAWVLGPGADSRDTEVMDGLAAALRSALEEGLPAVLDAGALALLGPTHPAHVADPLGPRVVLTPHAGELVDLLAARGISADDGRRPTRRDIEAAPARWARRAAEVTGATVLLKGPVTVIAAPTGPLVAQADATPWLATAGAGDVLAGVLGALLAGKEQALRDEPGLAATVAGAAAAVHGWAAREASGGGPLTAPDVAARLAPTIRTLLGEAAGDGRDPRLFPGPTPTVGGGAPPTGGRIGA